MTDNDYGDMVLALDLGVEEDCSAVVLSQRQLDGSYKIIGYQVGRGRQHSRIVRALAVFAERLGIRVYREIGKDEGE